MTYTLLYGYPSRWAQKIVTFVDLVGPSYYFTGGDEFDASQLGIGGIEAVFSGISHSGTYRCEGRALVNGAQTLIYLVFTLVSNGNEVAYGIDLSGETFRIGFVGV